MYAYRRHMALVLTLVALAAVMLFALGLACASTGAGSVQRDFGQRRLSPASAWRRSRSAGSSAQAYNPLSRPLPLEVPCPPITCPCPILRACSESSTCTTPLIGLYDAPDPEAFAPLVRPPEGPGRGRGACLFNYYRRWEKGETLHLTAERFGCGGCGRSLFGVQVRERDDFIDFLWRDEGLRASRELMAEWVDNAPTYRPEHASVLVGPLKPDLAAYLRTITFWVNADQLCVLQHGAYHHHAWGSPTR